MTQEFLGLSLAETVPANDRGNGVGDFCVADYLVEFSKVHRSQVLYTSFWILSRPFPWNTVIKEDKTPGGEQYLDPPGAEIYEPGHE